MSAVLWCDAAVREGTAEGRGGRVPDVYEVMPDVELRKAFDVWSGYLDARTGEDPQVRADLRAMLEKAREAASEGAPDVARSRVADM